LPGEETSSESSNFSSSCVERERELRKDVKELQSSFTAFEERRKPVIAAIHGACIGGGIKMITACDLQYCTKDASFSVKEVDLAITVELMSRGRHLFHRVRKFWMIIRVL
jgi:delta(3,5)-delta(2,4)-dienoyl-CoA isomerase